MDEQRFIELVVQLSREMGFSAETNRNGQIQIDFGHKKLHAGHLGRLFPGILEAGVKVPDLIK